MTEDEKTIITRSLTTKQKPYISIIFLSKAIVSPMICHIVRPKIYLPINFFHAYTLEEQKYVIQHEFLHFKRGDLLANSCMLFLSCISWFNPIIFLVYRYFRNAQELSCDAMVSHGYTPAEKKAYAEALIKTVLNQESGGSAVSCWWNTGIELKERCRMLNFHHSKPVKTFCGMFILISMFLTTVAAVSFTNRDALFTFSIVSAKDTDFVIKVFNNTNLHQPLHYIVKSPSQNLIQGQLYNGEFIIIDGFQQDHVNAEITIKAEDKIIWQGIVAFSRKDKTFYTKLLKLNPDFTIGIHNFDLIHTISLSIRSSQLFTC